MIDPSDWDAWQCKDWLEENGCMDESIAVVMDDGRELGVWDLEQLRDDVQRWANELESTPHNPDTESS